MNKQTIDTDYVVHLLKRFCRLNIENARLTLTEKLTLMLTGAVVWFMVILLAAVMLIFLSVCLCDVLVDALSAPWACLIIGGFYLLLIALVFIFRRPLILNPICRFISRLVLENPEKENVDYEKAE